MRYTSDGPAVMLGESTSIFPAQLAAYWRSRGLDVALVTHRSDAAANLPDGTPVIRSVEYETRVTRTLTRRVMSPVLSRIEKTAPLFKQRFSRITGANADSELWLPYFADYVAQAWPTMRAARSQRPRFVFGHEVTTYGLPTALCLGVPRIIFPWGGDVFTYAESSPIQFALTKFSLRAVDLVVSSSTTAAQHIRERFGVPPERVRAVSWGVDRNMFKRADEVRRGAICAKWKIDPRAMTIVNPRRFRPAWGAGVALEAFIQIASENPATHFILFGGTGTEALTTQARTKVQELGLSSRFTILEGDAPLEVCAELLSVSDVFVSLLGRGDLRSLSVLQATASGAVPIVSDLREYREMERLGFAGLFVRPDNVQDVLGALRFCTSNGDNARALAVRNGAYIAEHEDHVERMDEMLRLIDAVCASYARP